MLDRFGGLTIADLMFLINVTSLDGVDWDLGRLEVSDLPNNVMMQVPKDNNE